jgi:murein L,D-transpeptidase YcbB/YkuD
MSLALAGALGAVTMPVQAAEAAEVTTSRLMRVAATPASIDLPPDEAQTPLAAITAAQAAGLPLRAAASELPLPPLLGLEALALGLDMPMAPVQRVIGAAALPSRRIMPVVFAPASAMAPILSAAKAVAETMAMGATERADILAAAVAAWQEPVTTPLPAPLSKRLRALGQELVAIYAARDNRPFWLDADGRWTPAARSVHARLERAAEDGLEPRWLILPVLGEDGVADQAAMIRKDVSLSLAVVTYGLQAFEGRVDPRAISKLITPSPVRLVVADMLAAIVEAPDPGQALQALNPPHPAYAALRGALTAMRQNRLMPDAIDNTPVGSIAAEAKPGKEPGKSKGKGLSDSDLEKEIIANMERWRWMPRAMGADRIDVNIPDFSLNVVRAGAVIYRSKVIVGKTTTPTPIFSDGLQYIVVNPSWAVPQSIIRKEMMPKAATDPDYFKRMGYEFIERNGRVSVRQPPGERNALGHIKFVFPNDYAVYMHDTPQRALFSASVRAFSHGCVRVDQPMALAATLLGAERGWDENRLRRLIGRTEQKLPMPSIMPVHIQYFTAYVDEAGVLQVRDDIYGYSRKIRQAMDRPGSTPLASAPSDKQFVQKTR